MMEHLTKAASNPPCFSRKFKTIDYWFFVLMSLWLLGFGLPLKGQIGPGGGVVNVCDLEVDISSMIFDCDGTATVCFKTTGGTPPLTFTLVGGNDGTIEPTGTEVCYGGLDPGAYTLTVTDANNCTASVDFVIPIIDYYLEAEVTNVSCQNYNDGEIELQLPIDPIFVPYQFSWEGPGGFTASTKDIEDLIAGTYCVSVTEPNGSCVGTGCWEVTQPDELKAWFETTSDICDDHVDGCLYIEGGTSPYKVYVWNNFTDPLPTLPAIAFGIDGTPTVNNTAPTDPNTFSVVDPTDPYVRCANNIPAGWYLVLVVDENNCYELLWVHIPEPNPLEASFEITSDVCDDQVDGCLTIEGGTTPYNLFVWKFPQPTPTDPTVNIPATGVPTVNGNLPTNDIPFVQVPPDLSTICAENIPSGWYLVLVVDANQCYVLLWIYIPEPNPLEAEFEITSDICDGQVDGCLHINGGTEPYGIFVWQFPEPLPTDPTVDFPGGSTTPTINGTLPTNSIPFVPIQPGINSICAENIPAGWYLVLVVDANQCYVLLWVHIPEPNPLNANFQITSDVCDDQVDGCLYINGGTEPYNLYVWQFPSVLPVEPTVQFSTNGVPTVNGTTATNDIPFVPIQPGTNTICAEDIPPGWYLVLVVDANQCYVLLWVHIPSPNPLNMTGTVSHVSCNGADDGKITVAISGGTPPYAITLISSGNLTSSQNSSNVTVIFSNLSPGTYVVAVADANGCSASEYYTITEPDKLEANLDYHIYGDYACVAPTGGTSPYLITWSNVSSGIAFASAVCVYDLDPGIYTVQVVDANQCSVSESFIIQPEPCFGGIALVDPDVIESGETSTFYLSNWEGLGLQWQFRTSVTGWIDIPGATTEVYQTPPIYTGVTITMFIRAKVSCDGGGFEYSTVDILTVEGSSLLINPPAEEADLHLFDPTYRAEELEAIQNTDFTENIAATIYPTTSQGAVTVELKFESTKTTTVYVLDLNGNVLRTKTIQEVKPGQDLDFSLFDVPAGQYHILIENEGRKEVKRVFISR